MNRSRTRTPSSQKNVSREGRRHGGSQACSACSYSRVIVSDAVDVVLHVHSEGHPIQALVAHGAPEAAWVIGLPKGLEDLGVRGPEGSVRVTGSISRAPEQAWALSPWQVGGGLSSPLPERPQEAGGGSHHLHDEVSTHAALVSRLLEPGVLAGDTGSRRLRDKGALTAQPAAGSWPQVCMGIQRDPAPLTHQEVLLAVHFLAHIVERFPTKSSPCKDEGREGSLGCWRPGMGPCCHFSAPSSNRRDEGYEQTF